MPTITPRLSGFLKYLSVITHREIRYRERLSWPNFIVVFRSSSLKFRDSRPWLIPFQSVIHIHLAIRSCTDLTDAVNEASLNKPMKKQLHIVILKSVTCTVFVLVWEEENHPSDCRKRFTFEIWIWCAPRYIFPATNTLWGWCTRHFLYEAMNSALFSVMDRWDSHAGLPERTKTSKY